jgi:subtilisin family serine protease
VTKLDPLLTAQLRPGPEALAAGADHDRRVQVTVRFDGDPALLQEHGLVVESAAGRFASGSITLGELEGLAALDMVQYVEAARFLRPQLDRSVPEIRADQVRKHIPSFTGKGVIVGVVDTGIDIFHENFRTPGLSTRIRGIWDQTSPQTIRMLGAATGGGFELEFHPRAGPTETTGTIPFSASADAVRATLELLDRIEPGDVVVTGGPLPGTPVVVEFSGRYFRRDVRRMTVKDHVTGAATTVTAGRKYTPADIAAALATPDVPFTHRDNAGHGTHVAGIVAGDGSQSGACRPANTYIGVAPEAELLIVKTTFSDPDIAAGVEWIFTQAGAARTVVNLSLGGQMGPHDGTTALERRIDATLTGSTNRAVVVAAGNERDDGIHAYTTFAARQKFRWWLVVPPEDTQTDYLDIWYAGDARLRFTLTPPAGVPGAVGPVDPLDADPAQVIGGQTVNVYSRLHHPDNGKHSIFCTIEPPAKGEITRGDWTIELEELTGHPGEVDAWVDRQVSDTFWAFKEDEFGSDRSPSRCIGCPATARHVVAVGAYSSRPDEGDPLSYSLAYFSNWGPTTDGRLKPDICAPGVDVWAPRSEGSDAGPLCDCCLNFYLPKPGTSMSAPHVAGVAALILERNPGLTFDQIRDRITASGRAPEPNPGPSLPNSAWGHGRVDALRAVFPELPAMALRVHDGGSGATPPGAPGAGAPGPHALYTARIGRLEAAIRGDPEAHVLAVLVAAHVDEVRRLLDAHLRVAVAWHRLGGPDLVRILITSADPFAALRGRPPSAAWLGRFLEALDRYGSPRLRRDIARHSALLRRLADGGPQACAPAA